MYPDQAQIRKQYADDSCTETQAQGVADCANSREYTMSEQADKAAQFHSEQANKSYQAGEFFRSHPEFDAFIKLVRSGAIKF